MKLPKWMNYVQVRPKINPPLSDMLMVCDLVPARSFSAKGSQSIPSSFADKIPSIAFSVPDLDGEGKLELKAKDGGQNLACIESAVGNGKSFDVPAVSYIAAGIAAAALGLSALGALSASGQPGASTPSPSFTEVMFWFQGMAMNGMHSVDYPPIYRKFAKNFGFSTGLIPWGSMQTSIDTFRKSTGGNLTEDSYAYLKNATLVYNDGSTANTSSTVAKRGWELFVRQIETSVNGTDNSNNSTSSGNTPHFVKGIQGYVEQYTVPEANTFMTVLLVFAIVLAAVAVGILLFKVILEAWALFGRFPKNLTTFRKEYWRIMAQTITNLIFLLYGVWTLYSIFQFTHGDSWAAKLLAGVTLGVFTAILGYWTFRIWQVARRFKKMEGDAGALYENKETWKKYKNFYENFKRGYWWLFIPIIIYMFAKGCVLASADGHGLVQTAGQLIIEAVMLALLLWSRPYDRKSGNWINIVIQIVRVLSVVCILVFATELGIAKSTKTITGVILIAVQSSLTVVLAILIAVNAIITCVRENPHRRRRKEQEKLRDIDDLTPLDGRTSILMQPTGYKSQPQKRMSHAQNPTAYEPYREHGVPYHNSNINLVGAAAPMGRERSRSSYGSHGSPSPSPMGRQPTLPSVDLNGRRYSAAGR
jgi:Transient receptor potential (TRP) ion channel/ML-like domain